MRLPSAAGVLEALVLNLCCFSIAPECTSTFQAIAPESRSKRISLRLSVSDMEVVTKTLSLQTIGEERPSPGIADFQEMFSVADQVVGASVPMPIPSPRGPRHIGQSSLRVAEQQQSKANVTIPKLQVRMVSLLFVECP